MSIKKVLLFIVALVFLSALSAQTTQEQADAIVWECLNKEIQVCTMYAKEDVQEEMIITSSAEELLELDYACWVYYIRYAGNDQGRYLIVNESNGNLLEVNAKSGAEPEDLAEWRVVAKEIPFTEYSLDEKIPPSCCWIKYLYNIFPFRSEIVIINSNEKLENYTCVNDPKGWPCIPPCIDYPAIDFSKYTLLLASGVEGYKVVPNYKNLQQLSTQSYVMKVDLLPFGAAALTQWHVPIIVNKIVDDSIIELVVTIKFGKN